MELGKNAKAQICGHGDVRFHVKSGNKAYGYRIQSVRHLPEFEYSLLSVCSMDVRGSCKTSGNQHCIFNMRGKSKGTWTFAKTSLHNW